MSAYLGDKLAWFNLDTEDPLYGWANFDVGQVIWVKINTVTLFHSLESARENQPEGNVELVPLTVTLKWEGK